MAHREERYIAVIAILVVALLASHGPFAGEPRSVLENYAYWAMRIAIEALLFFVVRLAIEKYDVETLSLATVTALATAISHLPFVLSVTAIDIVLGYPELGMESGDDVLQPKLSALVLEAIYLLDNHIALCLLLSLPRWLRSMREEPVVEAATDGLETATLLSTLDPPLKGTVIWVEAQEHYVRITTTQETRMVLARFSDIIRELSSQKGMQVHRSHWVSETAILEKRKSGQNLNLVLSTGDTVPVSRSFRQHIESAVTV